MINHTCRRVMGTLLGALLGLTFGLASQTINMIALPGISFYQPPFGPWINIAMCFIGGALLGLVSSWPADSIRGTIVASGASALTFAIATLLSMQMDPQGGPSTVMVIAFFSLSVFGFLVPFIAVLRWAANKQEEAHADALAIWKRLPLPIVLLIVVGALGATTLYPPEARKVISRMNALIQAGRQAPKVAGLPKALQSDDVVGFLEQAQGQYTLEWNKNDLNRYAIPRPVTDYPGQESGVIARFENGWTLVCIFAPDNDEPECKSLQAAAMRQ